MTEDPARALVPKGVVVRSVAGAAIGMSFGGPVGAAAGALVPIAERIGELVVEEWRAKSEEQTAAMWWIAGDQTPERVESLLQSARQGTRQLHLAASASNAAAAAGFPAKVVALAKALDHGLNAGDDTILDVEQQVVEALARVELPHLEVLKYLDMPVPVSEREDVQGEYFTREQIFLAFPTFGPALTRVLGVLASEALIEPKSGGIPARMTYGDLARGREEPSAWRRTDFGAEILRRLTNLARDFDAKESSR